MSRLLTNGLGSGGGTGSFLTRGLATMVGLLGDEAIFADIRTRIEATGQFLAVYLEMPIVPADDTPVAYVEDPDDWEDIDDADPTIVLHKGRFRVTIAVHEDMVRGDVELSAYPTTQRLQQVVKNALNGQSLAGITLPDLTIVRRGKVPPKRTGPVRTIIMEGEFAYIVEGYSDIIDAP